MRDICFTSRFRTSSHRLGEGFIRMGKLYFRLRSGKFLWTWANGSGTYHPQNIRRYRPSPHHLVPAAIRPSHSRPCSADDVTSSQRKITVWRVQKCCSWAWTSPTIQAGSGFATFEDRRRIDQEEGPRSAYGEVSTLECGRGARYLHPHHPRSFRRFLHSYTFPPVVIECTLVREERAGW